jgi:hypothetical protein
MQDIVLLSIEELTEAYSIHIDEDDGTVWDAVEDKTFNSLRDWAEFLVEQDNEDLYGGVSKIGSKKYFDDGF